MSVNNQKRKYQRYTAYKKDLRNDTQVNYRIFQTQIASFHFKKILYLSITYRYDIVKVKTQQITSPVNTTERLADLLGQASPFAPT